MSSLDTKAFFEKEQQYNYIADSLGIRGFILLPRVLVQKFAFKSLLEFKLVFLDVTIQHVSL